MPMGGAQMIPVKTVQSIFLTFFFVIYLKQSTTASAAMTYQSVENRANTSLNQTTTNPSTNIKEATTNCQTQGSTTVPSNNENNNFVTNSVIASI